MLQRRLDEAVLALRSAEDARVQENMRRRDPLPPPQAQEEYLPPPPQPHRSDTSPPRRSLSELPSSKATLSDDEALFSQLLQRSNDKLLADLKESVESKVRKVACLPRRERPLNALTIPFTFLSSQLESVVKRQTDLFLSQNNSFTSSDGGSVGRKDARDDDDDDDEEEREM